MDGFGCDREDEGLIEARIDRLPFDLTLEHSTLIRKETDPANDNCESANLGGS